MRQTTGSGIFILLTSSFLGQFSMAVINLGLIFYTKTRFGLTPRAIGLLTSLSAVSYFIGLIGFKGLVSRTRPIYLLLIATAGMLLSGMLIIIAGYPWIVFLLYTFYGLCMSLFWPPVMGWLSRGMEGRDLGRRMSWFNVSWSAGIIIGPYVAGLLTERGTELALWGAGMSMAFIFVILSAAAFRRTSVRSISSGAQYSRSGEGIDSSTHLRYVGWIGIFSGYVVFGITMNIFPLFAQDVLQMAEGRIGFMLLIRALTATLVFILMGRLHFWHFSISASVGFQLLLALSLAVGIAASAEWHLILFFVLFGTAFAAIYSSSLFHGTAGSVNREIRMATHEGFLTSGLFFGSIMGGSVYQNHSFRSVLVMGLLIILTGAFLQVMLHWILSGRQKRSQAQIP